MTDKFGMEVTPDRWVLVDLEIKRFIRSYPLHWKLFQNDLKANRSKFNVATEGDLKQSNFRNTLAFPIIARPRTPEEVDLDPNRAPVEFGESLKHTLEELIPGFTAPDEGVEKGSKDVKPNKLYREFIRRYSNIFMPGEYY